MRFASLGSGSKGNSTIVESGKTCILVDCGFSVKDTVRRLERLDKKPEDLNAILVTHEHSDHWKGVLPLASRYSINVFITYGCLIATGIRQEDYSFLKIIDSHNSFDIDGISIKPIPVPHDAKEPVQYILSTQNHRFGILTDVGCITPFIEQQYLGCDGLLIEANHDLNLLQEGKYPSFLKQRVASQWGHLNNKQTANLISVIDQKTLKKLVIAHISQSNNHIDIVKQAIDEVIDGTFEVIYADQEEGFDWLYLGGL